MNRIIKMIFLTIAAITILTAPALGVITESEAVTTAEKYSKGSENIIVYGLYTYQNVPYYFIIFSPTYAEKMTSGCVVINAENGEIASKDVAEKIIIAECTEFAVGDTYMKFLENEIVYYKERDEILKTDIMTLKNMSGLVQETAKFEKIIETVQNVEKINLAVVENMEQTEATAKEFRAGNKSYEKAIEYQNAYNKYVSALDELVAIDDEYVNQAMVYYELENTINYDSSSFSWKIDKDEWLFRHQAEITTTKDILDHEKWYQTVYEGDVKYFTENIRTTENKSLIPGFSFIVSVFVLLIVGLFIKKQKK